MKPRNFVLVGILAISLFVFVGNIVKVNAETIIVNAFVDTQVSEEKSHVSVSQSEILADLSQRAIITVTILDKDESSLKDIKVQVVSNRGEIDSIIAVKAESGILSAEEDERPDITTTDENGVAIFRVSSTVPGAAIFSTIVDNITELNSVAVTFLPLPFPTDVTISVEVPDFISPDGKIVIFQPSSSGIDGTSLINTGTEIRIPLPFFITIVSFMLLGPILFIVLLALIGKIRKTEKKEAALLHKEAAIIEREEKLLEKLVHQKEQK